MIKNRLQANVNTIQVCPDCDLIIHQDTLLHQQTAHCPRCHAVVAKHDLHYLEKSLSYSLAGLLFYIPANFLPTLSFDVLGLSATSTLFNGVFQLFDAGYYWMSSLVLLCSVILPFLYLSLVFISSLFLKIQYQFKYLSTMLKWQQHIKEWAMLEVYMLSILIAYIKLADMGHIATDIGLYCFIGMLLSATLTQIDFHTENAFRQLETMRHTKTA